MIQRVVLLFFVIALGRAEGQTFQRALDAERTRGLITESDALYLEALGAHAPGSLPDRFQGLEAGTTKCGVPLHARVRDGWSDFSATQKSVLRSLLLARPSLDNSIPSPGGRFRIHYTTTGADAVPPDDADNSGVPDYVEEAARVADDAYSVIVDELGFRPPPEDQEVDGPEWDIYLEDIGNVYGWTTWETRLTVNPDTWTSYMRVNTDYSGFQTEGLDALRVTIAHEFFHMVQFGYHWRTTSGYVDLYLMEAGSVYMEDVCYDEVNDYYQYLETLFRRTNLPFSYNTGMRMYGLCIWYHFLEARLGHREALLRTWEHIVDVPALPATVSALADLGRSFEEELALFYGWNYMTGSRADETRFYPEGSHYPEIRMDGAFPFGADTSFTARVTGTGSRYYRFDENGMSYTVIPTNVYLPGEETAGECVLEIVHGGNHPLYKSLGNGVMTRIDSEDERAWRGVAVVEGGGPSMFVPFQEVDLALTASVGGMVWEDANADGVHDSEEMNGIQDAVLSLTGAGEDSLFGTEDDFHFPVQTTDKNGRYRFSGLTAGWYRVGIDASTISDAYVSSTGETPREVWADLGEEIENIDFGYRGFAEDALPAAIPNPFVVAQHEEVRIPFDLEESGRVRIALYSASGFQVFEAEAEYDTEGVHMYRWDGRDEQGEVVPSGIYVYLVVQDVNLIRREKLAVVR